MTTIDNLPLTFLVATEDNDTLTPPDIRWLQRELDAAPSGDYDYSVDEIIEACQDCDTSEWIAAQADAKARGQKRLANTIGIAFARWWATRYPPRKFWHERDEEGEDDE